MKTKNLVAKLFTLLLIACMSISTGCNNTGTPMPLPVTHGLGSPTVSYDAATGKVKVQLSAFINVDLHALMDSLEKGATLVTQYGSLHLHSDSLGSATADIVIEYDTRK